MDHQEHNPALDTVRRMMLAILVVGLIGTAVELLFMGHIEGWSQLVPIVLIAVTLMVVIWHIVSRSPVSLTAIRVLMAGFIACGALGIIQIGRAHV